MRIEHENQRNGAWAYLAAWDIRRAKIHGRCERSTGIAPFGRLLKQVMGQEPYRSARRVTVALANKMARIAWAVMAHGGLYRPAAAAQA